MRFTLSNVCQVTAPLWACVIVLVIGAFWLEFVPVPREDGSFLNRLFIITVNTCAGLGVVSLLLLIVAILMVAMAGCNPWCCGVSGPSSNTKSTEFPPYEEVMPFFAGVGALVLTSILIYTMISIYNDIERLEAVEEEKRLARQRLREGWAELPEENPNTTLSLPPSCP